MTKSNKAMFADVDLSSILAPWPDERKWVPVVCDYAEVLPIEVTLEPTLLNGDI